MNPAAIARTRPLKLCIHKRGGQGCLLIKGHLGMCQFPPPVLKEKDIQEACCQILELDGWRRVRMEQNYSERKRKVVGEAGMADDLFIRYSRIPIVEPEFGPRTWREWSQLIWIEWKRLMPAKRGKVWGKATRPAIHQRAWHAQERARGALTLIAGEDFPASIPGFKAWYKGSGLNRRAIL